MTNLISGQMQNSFVGFGSNIPSGLKFKSQGNAGNVAIHLRARQPIATH